MKPSLFGGLLLAIGSSAFGDFNPIVLTPGSFSADMVVESNGPPTLNSFVNATMDGGTNNNAWVFYEQGYATGWPWTGVPVAGSVFAAVGDSNHQFQMPSDYAANNAVLVGNYTEFTNGTLTLTTPAAYSHLSVLGSAGNGPVNLNYTIHHSGGADETGTVAIQDWFGGSSFAWYANGRVNMNDGTIGSLSYTNGMGVRLGYVDIPLVDTGNPVTGVEFSYVSGGRAGIFGLSGSSDGTTFAPIVVTGFNRDMIIEATAPVTGFSEGANVTMDNDSVVNSGYGWYERGFNRGNPATGLPVAGSSLTNGTRVYAMPASYTANNAVVLANSPGYTTATITFPTLISGITQLSFLNSSGNGPTRFNVTVHYAGGDFDNFFDVSSLDWFNGAAADYVANGRYRKEDLTFNGVNGGGVKLFHNDITLMHDSSLITSIDLSWVSGGRCFIFALSGSLDGGNFIPLSPISGFNADAVVESGQPELPGRILTATTASMDGGTNNTGATWYERGYYTSTASPGLPPAGSTFDSQALPDHHYQMAASYTANNAAYLDAVQNTVNLTPATPAAYSALSFLNTCANGSVTNVVVIQHDDGTAETNQFIGSDWYNTSVPYAYSARGRVQLDRRRIQDDPGRNGTPVPRLFEAQFFLSNFSSPITNILLQYGNPTNSGGRIGVFAVSAATGAVGPIISANPVSYPRFFETSNLTFNVGTVLGTIPITNNWQFSTDGGTTWTDLTDGGQISGATTTVLSITAAGFQNNGLYRIKSSNVVGTNYSGSATVYAISPLPDVTQPTDQIVAYQPNGGSSPAAESVEMAIDNTTTKYLNFGPSPNGPLGFEVTPGMGGTIVSALRFYTANDSAGRDPASYVLEGSNDGGASYTTISSGVLSLPGGRNDPALALAPLTQVIGEVHFANTTGYTRYRVSFPATKSDDIMQIGEVELLGVADSNSVPTVLIAPKDTSANQGSSATFSVTAIGPGTIGYRWYDVTAGDPGTLIPGQNTATLTLSPVTSDMNNHNYRVVVTNEHGAVVSPATFSPGALLTVVSGVPNVVTDLPSETVVYAGRTAVLAVPLSGTEPFTNQWQVNGSDLSDTARISGSHSNVLSISNSQTNDAGSYQLFVSNGDGNAQSATTALIVHKVAKFSDTGAGWALNGFIGSATVPASMVNQLLELTSGSTDSRSSAWYKFPQYVGAFKASFTYQDVTMGGADGAAFVLQNDPTGTNALGGGGGGLGYQGITNSAALEFNIFGTSGFAFHTNGNTGGYSSGGAVDVAGGDPIAVEITYIAGVVHLVMSNTVTAATFSTNLAVGDLTAVLGAKAAIIGFTGATGGVASTQQISNFSYVPLPTVTANAAGGNVVLSWPASVGAFVPVSRSSLTSGDWSPVGGAVNLVGDHYEVTITPQAGAQYFKLGLQ